MYPQFALAKADLPSAAGKTRPFAPTTFLSSHLFEWASCRVAGSFPLPPLGEPWTIFVSLHLSLVWVFRIFFYLFFRAFPAFPKLFSMLVALAVAVFPRFVIEISSHAPTIAVPHIFVSFLHARGRVILTWHCGSQLQGQKILQELPYLSCLGNSYSLSLVRSPHVLNFDLSNSLLQTLGVSVEKQTKARAATAAKELCIGLLDRLRQTRFFLALLETPTSLERKSFT